MKALAIINQKGGVGKSTTALNIGAGLILKGFSVLYIDLDAQGNLSYTMGATTSGYNAFGVIQRPETVAEEIQHTPQGDIIASSPSLSQADITIKETGKEYRLKEALEMLGGVYDFAIIDTPPALGILTINALTACSGVIIPTLAEVYSLQGISQIYNTIQTVKKYCNHNLKIEGILITRFSGRSIIKREIAEALEERARSIDTKLYKTKIRECTALIEAQAKRRDIFSYAPKSNAAADYKALVAEILENKGEEDNGRQ